MIGYIKGEAIINDDSVIMECNGIGYEVAVSNTTLVKIKNGSPYICLYTYMSVREDGISLFGFYTKEEKNMFLKLTTISGVGPKAALGILSGIDINDLMSAILSADIKRLSKVKGIGKKTAERIVLELREQINAESQELLESITKDTAAEEPIDKNMADAISALRGLGFTQAEATNAVKNAKPFATTAEELVARALRSL